MTISLATRLYNLFIKKNLLKVIFRSHILIKNRKITYNNIISQSNNKKRALD